MESKQKVIVVIGKARAGKTTFSNFLAKEMGLKTSGTSKIVYEVMAKARGCTIEELNEIPKEELRPHLIALADHLCDMQPDILSRTLIKRGYLVLDGIRRHAELEALKENFDLEIVYILREKGTKVDNFNIPTWVGDHKIYNNGSLTDLEKGAKVLAETLKND
jgi:dephospho-CoA kinase